MNHDLTVSESVEINTSPDKVWEGLTNPDIIKDYLFGTETLTDWKPGSKIIFQGEYEGKHYRDKGVIKENILNKKLSYTYWSGFSGLEDKPDNYSLITYTLDKLEDNKTKFTWTQKGYANDEAHNHSVTGMRDFLAKIKETIEGKELS